ncbi:ABC transporter permease [Feifania hominis]|uniref:ABC transporter permease n=1 Tax=Feifania hominis TaxID=2763660 RepID=A0A926HT51_9FIRM|nr:ABC transporter permease [Feifania hominis]MBC8535504.1 ABC transporter permease [Feifania hominis]
MKRSSFAYPYTLIALILFLAPLVLIVFYSFTTAGPDGGVSATLENFKRFFDFDNPQYMLVLLKSFKVALISTVICLLVGFPMAYILSKMKPRMRNFVSVLFILPMWMNFLLRIYAWMTLLEKNGLINNLLRSIGLPGLNIMYTEGAVVLGTVYNFLPFMILPIYNVLTKLDNSLIEASHDLGAGRARTFFKVVVPLSLPGVFSGINMVFMPAVTTFAISRLLGGTDSVLIGDLIEKQFKLVDDWGFGSAMSVIIMLLVLLVMFISSKFENDKEEGGMLF